MSVSVMEVGVNGWQDVAVLRRGCMQPTNIEQNIANARTALVLGGVLVLLQAADGWLTSLGVSRFGVGAEGNPLLRFLMEQFGHVPILSVVKLIGIIFIIALTHYAKKLVWVQHAMGAVTCIYLFAAILPWTYILLVSPHF